MKIDKKYCLFIFLLILSEIFFFRNVLFNDILFGNLGDGRLTMLITEHWYRFCCGLEKINDLGIFYPLENTLAYSDMLLGYGIIHSFFRFCGLDMFISYKVTLILVHLFGVFTLFYFLNKVLKIDYFWAFFGTSAFSFSCTYANQFLHTQLNTISFIPLFLIFFVKSIQNVDNQLKKNIFMYSAIFIIILTLYTAWYIFFFSVLFIAIFLVVGLFFVLFKKIDIKYYIRKIGYDIIGYIIVSFLLMIPFLLSELPVMEMSGNRDYKYILNFLGYLDSYILSSDSVFNNFFALLFKFSLIENFQMGFSLVLLTVFIFCFIFLFTKSDNGKKNGYFLYKILFITLIICLLLPIKIPFTNFSFWFLIYKYFLGGNSIRFAGRFIFFLSLPMAIIISIVGNCFWNIKNIEYKRYLLSMSILCIFLFVSNINTVGTFGNWNKKLIFSFLNTIPQPPNDCKVIFLKKPIIFFNKINRNILINTNLCHMLDSHEIAIMYNKKTINGYSGVVPKDYGIKEPFCYSMENFYSGNYEISVLDWIKRYKLEDVYSYDIINKKWEKVEVYEK